MIIVVEKTNLTNILFTWKIMDTKINRLTKPKPKTAGWDISRVGKLNQ